MSIPIYTEPFKYTEALYKSDLWQLLSKLSRHARLTDGANTYSPSELRALLARRAAQGHPVDEGHYAMLPGGIVEFFDIPTGSFYPVFAYRFIDTKHETVVEA